MQITFLGACNTVTGSKYLIKHNNRKYLIDCGMFQGYKELRLRNWSELPIEPSSIDAVLLTHAHIDHSGYLPLFIKKGFDGPVYSTHATKDLCSILLPDSGYLHEEEARRANKYGYTKHKLALPLYTKDDGENAIGYFKSLNYNEPLTLDKGCTASWYNVGHILGASAIKLDMDGTSIVFSGDLGRYCDPIMKEPEKIDQADYIVVESTYGDRLHKKIPVLDQLEKIIKITAKRGGTTLIPAFAVGRSQLILYYLYQLKIGGRIPDIPIYLDSPMALAATKYLHKHVSETKIDKDLCEKICRIAKYSYTKEDSIELDLNSFPKIIISASGMMTGGRILHHIQRYASDHRNSIVISGFQAGGTRGAKILAGDPEIKIFGQLVKINADVHDLSNISSHPDYKETLKWLKGFKNSPKTVFITHGETTGSEGLKKHIESEFGWNCVIPKYSESAKLQSNYKKIVRKN